MAGELAHASVGGDLSQTEWESINTHVLSGGAVGDILYWNGTNIRGLAVGAAGTILTSDGTNPAWTATASLTLNNPTITGQITATSLSHSPAISAVGSLFNINGTITEAASGTHALLAGISITAPTVTAGAGTVTNTAVVYIDTAMVATVTGANYAIWVDSGAVQFDSTLGVGSTLTVQGGGLIVSAGGAVISSGGLTISAGGSNVTGGVTLASGNLTFNTTGQRITGDMSSAVLTDRVSFQGSVANSPTNISVLPNGTSTTCSLILYAGSNASAAGRFVFTVAGTIARILTSPNGGTEPTEISFSSSSFSTIMSMSTTTGATTLNYATTITSGGLVVTAGNMSVGGTTTNVAMAIRTTGSTTTGTSQFGVFSASTASSSSTTDFTAILGRVITAAASFTVTSGYSLYAATPQLGAGSAITSQHGVYVTNQGASGITNAYGVYISAQASAATLNIGLYNAGTTRLDGTAGIGVAPVTYLAVYLNGAVTSGNVSQAGVYSDATYSSAATTSGQAVYGRVNTAAAAFTMVSAYAFYAANAAKGASSAITNEYGLYVEAQTAGTNNYGVYINAPSGGTINIGLYNLGVTRLDGNVHIGGLAVRSTTNPTNALSLYNGTAPVGTLTNGATLYTTAGELWAMDAAGNATIQSPHDSGTGEWIFLSRHTPTGRTLRVDMEKLVKAVNDHFGWDFVREYMEVV